VWALVIMVAIGYRCRPGFGADSPDIPPPAW
jgi:hypothetical protein